VGCFGSSGVRGLSLGFNRSGRSSESTGYIIDVEE
jgi:hypothetical protein